MSFLVNFDPMTVKEIIIKWKYPAKTFDVQGLLDGYWRSFAYQSANKKTENKINLGFKTISGIKILMTNTESKFNGKSVYGISEIEIKTGAKNVGLKDCSLDNGRISLFREKN